MFRGDNIVVGMCLPLAVKDMPIKRIFRLESAVAEASSLADLRSSADKNFFFDRKASIVYRKFTETRDRTDADKVTKQLGYQ